MQIRPLVPFSVLARFVAFGALVAMLGCGREAPFDAGLGPAEVSVAITQAPPRVSCIRVTAAGSQTAVASFQVHTNQSTGYRMSGLPTGSVSFRAEAFPVACSDSLSEPTWASDPVTVVLHAGSNGNVTLLMKGTASATVGVDFPGPGADDRSRSDPTSWWWYYGISPEQLSQVITSHNARIVSIKAEQTDPYRFTVAMVKNEGVYAKAWWWYYGITADDLSARVRDNQARIIDLDAYDIGGQARFAVAMVSNIGPEARTWWWYYNVTPDFIDARLQENGARPIDIDTYLIGGKRYYSVVMIANQGVDAEAWWLYYDVSPGFITTTLQQNNARLIDIEPHGAGTFTVIMVERSQGQHWWWYYGVNANQLLDLALQNGARIFDVKFYVTDGQSRFVAIMLNNSNALTTRMGQIMRTGHGGATGFYLKEVGGPVLAALLEQRVFEPASTIKVVEHLYAMSQAQASLASLDEPINVYQAYSGSCPLDQPPIVTESLRTSLQLMMVHSDNARTEAVQKRFGRQNFNAMAQELGMRDTSINHRLGCVDDAIAHPNRLTLVDAGLLYEGVANGSLLTPTKRTTFYSLMESGLGFYLRLVDGEAGPLNIPAADVQSFKSMMADSSKSGNYTLAELYVSAAGVLRIPFFRGHTSVPHDYVYGVYIDKFTDQARADAAWSNGFEIFREQVRAGLMSMCTDIVPGTNFQLGGATIPAGGSRDYCFNAGAGERFVFQTCAPGSGDFGTIVEVRDGTGGTVLATSSGACGSLSQISGWQAPSTGQYVVRVRGISEAGGSFSLAFRK